jgi:radical SAM protein with 4Fe4S-binding SPASM domain
MSYSPFRHIDSVFWKRNPVHLTFFLTKRCNARCPFCFYLSGRNAGQSDGDELSLDEIRKISSSMGNLLWLAFSGGEIFLRSDIVDITKAFYETNRPAILLFPTNGFLSDVILEKMDDIMKMCIKSTVVVKLSIEGTETVHDAIRGNGSFRKVMKTYSAMGELLDRYPNFELGINTVMCSENQDHMDELIEFVNGLEYVKTHTVSLIRGNVGDEALKDVKTEKYFETIKKLARNLQKKKSSTYRFRGAGLKAAQDILQRRLIHETMVRKKQMLPCYAGRLNIVLTESGDVYPCEEFSMKIGNVRNQGYDMKNILKTPQAKRVIRSIRNNDCYCTHECYVMTNVMFNPLMYPELLREYVRI